MADPTIAKRRRIAALAQAVRHRLETFLDIVDDDERAWGTADLSMVDGLLNEVRAIHLAMATFTIYETKLGHTARIFGHRFLLKNLRSCQRSPGTA